MTDAQTGNSMIPSNPGVAAAQLRDGAQAVAPLQAGAPPMAQVPTMPAPAPEPVQQPVESYDFWESVEQRVEPGQLDPVFQEPQQPAAVPTQPVAPVQQPGVPATQYALPEGQLSQEQQAAIVEAGAAEQGIAPQRQQQAAPQQQQVNTAAVEQQTIAHLAATEYALPKDEATRLVTEPEVVFPQLAARLHVRLATQLGQAVQQILPSIIEQVVDQKMKAQGLENDFFRSYPQLSDPRFRNVVAHSLRMARQASPQATRDQVMSDGAALAAMKLRLQLTNGAQQPPVGTQVPAVPQQPVAAVPVQPYAQPVHQPFQPAVGGGSVGLPIQQVPQNEFEVLAMDENW